MSHYDSGCHCHYDYDYDFVGACGLADQCWVHETEGCGFEPRYGQRVVSLSKALYHNYSSRPRCINGYRQCWEGNRLVVEEV